MSLYKEPNFPAVFVEGQANLREFDKNLLTALNEWGLVLKAILDRGILLADNVDAAASSYTSNAVANTEDAVPHTLGKIPTYFIVGDIDKGGVVYRSGTAFTKTTAYLKCTTTSTVLKIIFL